MSLFFFITPTTVVIQKYKLEFPFVPPPAKTEKTATKIRRMLRNSASMQIELTQEEKKEVIGLLQRYGLALFRSIVPMSLRKKIYYEGGIFIFATDIRIVNIPWELLYDGKSFFALTHQPLQVPQSCGR